MNRVPCTNPECSAAVREGAKFCSKCGKPQQKKSVLPPPSERQPPPQASRPMGQGMGGQTQRFQAPTMSQASPEAIERFRALLISYAEDGIFEDWELQELATEGQKLGISSIQQKQLMSEFKAIVGIPIRVWSDSISCEGLKAGFRGEVVLKIMTDKESFQNVILYVTESAGQTQNLYRQTRLRARREVKQPIEIPSPSAGFHGLDALIQLETQSGLRLFFEIDRVRLSVASDQPQGESHFHLSSSGNNSNVIIQDEIKFAANQAGAAGVISNSNWLPLKLGVMIQEEAADWLLNHGFTEQACTLNPDLAVNPYSTLPPQPTPAPAPEPEPQGPQRMDMASGRPAKDAMIKLNVDGREFTLFIFTRSEIFFGRDGNKSDVTALIEPIEPHHLHAENIQKSMRVSSRHMSIYVENGRPMIQDVGSGNGTTLNGRKLAPRNGQRLHNDAVIDLAGVLQMSVDSFLDDEGSLSAVQVSRINNMPDRKVVLLQKEYGLGHPISIFGRASDAFPMVIRFEEDELRLYFQKEGSFDMEDLPANSYVPLKSDPAVVIVGDVMLGIHGF